MAGCVDDDVLSSKVRGCHYDMATIRKLALQAGVFSPISKKCYHTVRSLVLMHFVNIAHRTFHLQYIDKTKTAHGRYVAKAIKEKYGVVQDIPRYREKTMAKKYTSDACVAFEKLVKIVQNEEEQHGDDSLTPEFLKDVSENHSLQQAFAEIVDRHLNRKKYPNFLSKTAWKQIFMDLANTEEANLICNISRRNFDKLFITTQTRYGEHFIWTSDGQTDFDGDFDEWDKYEADRANDFFNDYGEWLDKKIIPKLEVSHANVLKVQAKNKQKAANPFITAKHQILNILQDDLEINVNDFEEWFQELDHDAFDTDPIVTYKAFKDIIDICISDIEDETFENPITLIDAKVTLIGKLYKYNNNFNTNKEYVHQVFLDTNRALERYNRDEDLSAHFNVTWIHIGCELNQLISIEDEYKYFLFKNDAKTTKNKFKELITQIFGAEKGGKLTPPQRDVQISILKKLELDSEE